MRTIPSLIVLVALVLSVPPALAQVPIAEALRRVERVVLMKDASVEQQWLDRVAREITNWRGAPQWELVPQGAEADLVIILRGESESAGYVVAPYPFAIIGSPLESNTYELTALDAVAYRETKETVILWQDRRTVTWTKGGAVADLVKGLLRQVAAQQVASAAARPVAPSRPPPGTLAEWAASVAAPSTSAAPASDEPVRIEDASCAEYQRDRLPGGGSTLLVAVQRKAWVRGFIDGVAQGYVAQQKGERLEIALDRLKHDFDQAVSARIARQCADRPDESLYRVAMEVAHEAARHLLRP